MNWWNWTLIGIDFMIVIGYFVGWVYCGYRVLALDTCDCKEIDCAICGDLPMPGGHVRNWAPPRG